MREDQPNGSRKAGKRSFEIKRNQPLSDGILNLIWREQTILACIDEGVGTIPAIVARLYGGLDADLKVAAALSVLAHLEFLIARGFVSAEGSNDGLSAFYIRAASGAAASASS